MMRSEATITKAGRSQGGELWDIEQLGEFDGVSYPSSGRFVQPGLGSNRRIEYPGVCPHSLASFNELASGPRAGHRHLGLAPMDTNLDCGQNLLYLRWWLDKHPHVKDLRAALVACVPAELLSLPMRAPPAGPAPAPARVQANDTLPRWTSSLPLRGR